MIISPAIYSEQMVLGGLFLDPKLIDQVRHIVSPLDFHNSFNKDLFAAMLTCYHMHDTFSVETISDHLEVSDAGKIHIHSLKINCFSTNNIVAHAEIIKEKSIHMQLMQIARDGKCMNL